MTKAFSLLFWLGSKMSVLGKNKIKGCFVFFIHHKGRIIPLYQNRCRQTYMQKGGIKDCQNMHQSNILCNSNQSQFLEGRRQKQKEREREYKSGNQLFYLLQILLQTFVHNSILLLESDYFRKSVRCKLRKKEDVAQM